MSRWKAASLHFCLSIAIFLFSLALLLLLWYPQPYFAAAGGKLLLFLIAGVDIALGPLITLIIFKSGKWGLKFDLTVIACLQLAALIYGMSAVVHARPAYVVFAIDRFVVVPAVDVDLEGAPSEYANLPWAGPRLVAAQLPTDIEERNTLMFSAGLGASDLEQLPRYYRPYSEMAQKAAARGKPLSALLQKKPDAKKLLDAFLEDHELAPEEMVYLPMNARKLSMVMVLKKSDGQPVGGIAVDPW